MATYIALLRKIPESDFSVSFPDFLGCITAGRTLDEAYRMAEEALAFHIEGMQKDGDPIPEPSSLDVVMADSENKDAIPFLVKTDTTKVRSLRINVTLEEPLVREIDRMTNNRSGFLAEGARLLLKQRG